MIVCPESWTDRFTLYKMLQKPVDEGSRGHHTVEAEAAFDV